MVLSTMASLVGHVCDGSDVVHVCDGSEYHVEFGGSCLLYVCIYVRSVCVCVCVCVCV